jgi:hypothetical protein
MSQLNSLLESANPYKSLQSDAARLASKWSKTGLLEGLSDNDSNNMSMLLENQAKQLVTETSNTGGGAAAGNFTPGTGAQWAGVALPLVRKVFGQIAAKEFVSVQPMNLPSGLVFYLDFQYGTTKIHLQMVIQCMVQELQLLLQLQVLGLVTKLQVDYMVLVDFHTQVI